MTFLLHHRNMCRAAFQGAVQYILLYLVNHIFKDLHEMRTFHKPSSVYFLHWACRYLNRESSGGCKLTEFKPSEINLDRTWILSEQHSRFQPITEHKHSIQLQTLSGLCNSVKKPLSHAFKFIFPGYLNTSDLPFTY